MDVVSKVLPGKTHLFKGWAMAKAAVTRPLLGLVFDKIQRARVCPLAVTGLISVVMSCFRGPGTGGGFARQGFPRSGLCQARLNVCEAELVAGFLAEVVIEHPGVD